MAKLSKRQKALASVDREKFYAVDEAISLIKANATAKFDETIEVAMNLGVDPRHADQMVRGVVNLPKGTGKAVRVAVFAKGAKADEATAAGADVVGDHLVEHRLRIRIKRTRALADDLVGQDRREVARQLPGAEERRPVDRRPQVAQRPRAELVKAGVERRRRLSFRIERETVGARVG